jgi:hypothetical protein
MAVNFYTLPDVTFSRFISTHYSGRARDAWSGKQ